MIRVFIHRIILSLFLLSVILLSSCSLEEPDETPPSCLIIYPVSGQAVAGTVKIVIGALDNDKVTNINLYVDGEVITRIKSEPYEYLWDTTPIADNQDHVIMASATDANGNSTYSAPVRVRVVAGGLPDTLAPVITILNPERNAVVSDTVNVIVQIVDDSPILKVEYYIDGYLRYTTESEPYTFQWVVSNLIDGSTHSLFAKAYDENLNSSFSNVVRVTIQSENVLDNQPPSIVIIYPTAGSTVSDTVEILAQASDNLGMDRLQLYVDGELHQTLSHAPWIFLWDVSNLVNGSVHKIFILGFDVTQNQGISDEIPVTIQSNVILDITPPSIFISYPPSGAVLNETTTIIASANDDIGVTKVEFYLDGLLRGTDPTEPYEYILDISTFFPGSSHTLFARAYDGAGNQSQTPLQTITIAPADVQAPTVQIIFPLSGSTVTKDTTTIIVEARDNTAVTHVEFFIDGNYVASDSIAPYTYDWIISSLPNNSSYTILAKAYDPAGNVGNSGIITLIVQNKDNIPPTMIILYPTAGTTFQAGHVVPITVDVFDNIGIDRVEFYIDGELKFTDTTAPYRFDWDTSGYGDGQGHSIYVKTYDLAGNTATQLITVTIIP
ncbi:MAG: hypothetical protein Kow0042_26110 [Calditrichia bacterium]